MKSRPILQRAEESPSPGIYSDRELSNIARTPATASAGCGMAVALQVTQNPPAKLITHRFPLDDIMKAYDTFGNAAQERALKVILTNPA